MDFESMRQLLESNEMEEEQAPRSTDVFNIFCKKDDDHINTIQVVEDENGQGAITEEALRLLVRAISDHQRDQHQIDYQVSIYEDVSEPAFKAKT